MTDQYAWWREALSGALPPVHEAEPQCGYFKVRDGRGLNAKKHPVSRPFVAAAIWKEGDEWRAEIAGLPIPMDYAWPWFAKHPVSYEDYTYWHANERWPDEKDDA